MNRVIDEFQIGKYTILKFKELPQSSFNRLRIDGKIYDIVPSYDMVNCLAVESSESFLNKKVDFIM